MLVNIAAACLVTLGRLIAAEATGAVQGHITFNGEIPKNRLPDDSGIRDPLVEVDPQGKGIRGVVVYVKTASAHHAAAEQPPSGATMDQANNRFAPRILAVRAGQKVRFTNSDAGNHNVRASSSIATNEFNIFTGVEGSYERTFAPNPSGQPVRVGCDIHPWMRAWIYVFDHPFFAVTDPQGTFKIDRLPPGEYELILVQPDLGYRETKKISIHSGQTAVLNAEARSNHPQVPNP